MTCEFNKLKVNSIPEWMKEIEKICQEQEERKLLENREKYDHVIELT